MTPSPREIEKEIKYALWRIPGFLFTGRAHPGGAPPDLQKIRSVLVVRPDRLGDAVLSTPVYESVKRSLPDARVTALLERTAAGIVADNPFIDQILPLDRARPWNIIPKLLRGEYDLAFTLHKTFSATASVLTFLSGARFRVGYHHPQNAWMHHLTLPTAGEPRHEIENNLDLLHAAGLSTLCHHPRIYFNDAETQMVDTLLRENRQAPDRPLVLIKPGTRIAAWGWSLEKFQKVIENLQESGTAEVFILRGPGEEELIDSLVGRMTCKPFVVPLLAIKELARLIAKSNLLVCNHTGIMHLTSATETPVLVIFKHGEIRRWGPCHTHHINLEERGNAALPPETVLKNINQLLSLPKQRSANPSDAPKILQ
ncbi:MAG: glycosyltransferase family 9 protein [Nitrospinaceae bacterium]